jgi:hypothetical protein
MKSNQEFYSEKMKNQLHETKKVGWDNIQKAEKRYKFIANLVPDNCTSLVDYGCGLGAFSRYTTLNYVGVDVNGEFIDAAKKAFPDTKFIKTSINGKDQFLSDCLVNIGAYTLAYDKNGEEYWNEIKEEIVHQAQTIRKCIIVNGFHEAVDYKDVKLFYHSFADWVKLANELNMNIDIKIFEKYEFVIRLFKKYQ